MPLRPNLRSALTPSPRSRRRRHVAAGAVTTVALIAASVHSGRSVRSLGSLVTAPLRHIVAELVWPNYRHTVAAAAQAAATLGVDPEAGGGNVAPVIPLARSLWWLLPPSLVCFPMTVRPRETPAQSDLATGQPLRRPGERAVGAGSV